MRMRVRRARKTETKDAMDGGPGRTLEERTREKRHKMKEEWLVTLITPSLSHSLTNRSGWQRLRKQSRK